MLIGLIGLIGLKGSGKDTLVDSLSAKYGSKKIVNLKYANGIKEMLERYFNISKNVYENPALKEVRIVDGTRMTSRQLMIKIGTVFREINPDFWVNYTINQYLALQQVYPNSIIIITDCRFFNELKAIKANNGFILDVRRNNLYTKEKKIVKRYGVNFVSRFLVQQVNPLLTHDSEWNYFRFINQFNFPVIDNTSLQNGIEQLENFIF